MRQPAPARCGRCRAPAGFPVLVEGGVVSGDLREVEREVAVAGRADVLDEAAEVLGVFGRVLVDVGLALHPKNAADLRRVAAQGGIALEGSARVNDEKSKVAAAIGGLMLGRCRSLDGSSDLLFEQAIRLVAGAESLARTSVDFMTRARSFSWVSAFRR